MDASTLTHRVLGILAVSAVATGVAACGSQRADKSGASVKSDVTLTLEMPDHGDKLGAAFAAAVARRSRGSVRVEIGRGYDGLLPANELHLARALEAGRTEIAYLPARAWSAAGIPAFRALLAPFAVTTNETAQAVASGQIARDVLAALPRSVVGLALVPAESRRVLAVQPPLSPADFRGLRLRVGDDPQSAAAFEALGATPVQGLPAREAITALRDRRIDGVESSPASILINEYWTDTRHLSAYGVFPNFESIALSRAAWQRLSPAQREAVRTAAEDAVKSARTIIAAQERAELAQLCAAGVRVAVPTAQQLKQLVEAARPAAAGLARDATAARVVAAIDHLPGAGPRPLAAPLPGACTHDGGGDRPATAATPAAFPNGVYVTKVSSAQFHEAGAYAPKHLKDWTLTTRMHDGRWTQTVRPTFPDECADVPSPAHPACRGTYRVNGDKVTVMWSQPRGVPERLKWSYFDGVLRFEPIDITDPSELAIYGQPWRKVG
jgi:TRAP-type transport system periplasmic protein